MTRNIYNRITKFLFSRFREFAHKSMYFGYKDSLLPENNQENRLLTVLIYAGTCSQTNNKTV